MCVQNLCCEEESFLQNSITYLVSSLYADFCGRTSNNSDQTVIINLLKARKINKKAIKRNFHCEQLYREEERDIYMFIQEVVDIKNG